MNLYLSRDGQTFGPYTVDQAREYLSSGQFLAQDYALFEGESEWKFLGQMIASHGQSSESQPGAINETVASAQANAPLQSRQGQANEKAPQSSARPNAAKKGRKISRKNRGKSVVVTKQKGIGSKVFSIIIVFSVTLVLAAGIVAGLYFAMPSTIGPFLGKLGIGVGEQAKQAANAPTDSAANVPTTPGEILLDPEHWQRLRISGIRILPIEGGTGLQVVSSIDSDLAMQDDDLSALSPLAGHIVSLDLTKSKITDHGLEQLVGMTNLERLHLEGVEEITGDGISKLRQLEKLSYLNLVRSKMDDSLVDTLIGMKNLREVYLYQSGLSEDAISRLGVARPKMFVKGG